MKITADKDLTFIDLDEQQEGMLNCRGSIIEFIQRNEPSGDRVRLAVSSGQRYLVMPTFLVPAFLRYPATNPVEVSLQQAIERVITSGALPTS